MGSGALDEDGCIEGFDRTDRSVRLEGSGERQDPDRTEQVDQL